MSTPDDRPRRRSRSGTDLSRHRRRARSLQALQVGRSSIRTDALQISIGRDQPNRRDIKVRGRDDAGDALRSSSSGKASLIGGSETIAATHAPRPRRVIRDRAIQRQRRSMSAMHPIATEFCGAAKMTLSANRRHSQNCISATERPPARRSLRNLIRCFDQGAVTTQASGSQLPSPLFRIGAESS